MPGSERRHSVCRQDQNSCRGEKESPVHHIAVLSCFFNAWLCGRGFGFGGGGEVAESAAKWSGRTEEHRAGEQARETQKIEEKRQLAFDQ